MTNEGVVDHELSTALYRTAARDEKMGQRAGRTPPALQLMEQRPAIHGHVGPGIDGGVRRQRIGSRSYNNLHSSRRQERTTRLARRRRELVMIMGFFNCL